MFKVLELNLKNKIESGIVTNGFIVNDLIRKEKTFFETEIDANNYGKRLLDSDTTKRIIISDVKLIKKG